MNPTELLQPEQRRPGKAYLVNELRKAVYPAFLIDGLSKVGLFVRLN